MLSIITILMQKYRLFQYAQRKRVFFLQNNKDFRPKAFPRSSLAVGRDYLWLMFCTCSVYVRYLFSVRPNMYRTSTEELSNIIRDYSLAIPLLHYGISKQTSECPKDALQYYRLQFLYFRFQISVCFLKKRPWIRIQNTVLCSVFSYSVIQFCFCVDSWQLTVLFFNFLADGTSTPIRYYLSNIYYYIYNIYYIIL